MKYIIIGILIAIALFLKQIKNGLFFLLSDSPRCQERNHYRQRDSYTGYNDYDDYDHYDPYRHSNSHGYRTTHNQSNYRTGTSHHQSYRNNDINGF